MYINETNKHLIILDPGHGLYSPHKKIVFDDFTFYEGEFNRNIASKLHEDLIVLGINSTIIVKEKSDISLTERVSRANKLYSQYRGWDLLYVSLHGNAHSNNSASGYEIYTSPGKTMSDKYATIFYRQAAKIGWRMRSDFSDGDADKEARFTVLTKTKMPAVLIESGFYSNEAEARKMLDAGFQYTLSKNMADAIVTIKKTYWDD